MSPEFWISTAAISGALAVIMLGWLIAPTVAGWVAWRLDRWRERRRRQRWPRP